MPASLSAPALDLSRLWAQWHDTRRLYRLAGDWTDGLHVEAWVGREALGTLPEWRILCLSLDGHRELKSLVGQTLTLQTVLPDGGTHETSGMVRAAEALDSNGGLARYRLTVVPWLWLATQQARSRVFHDCTVQSLIEQILQPYAAQGKWRFADDVEHFLEAAPKRRYCTQYRESDYAFFARLMAEEGLGWRIEADAEAPQGHTLVIFADSVQQPALTVSPVRFHRRGAQESRDAVQALVRRTRQGVAQVSLAAWHVDGKTLVQGTAPTLYPTGGTLAPRIEYDDVLGLEDNVRGWQDSGTVEHYARLLMEAAEARSDMLLGRGSVRGLQGGMRLAIDEAPALGLDAAPELVLDAIEHAGINNLPDDVAATVATLIGDAERHLTFDTPPPPPDAEIDLFGLLRADTADEDDIFAPPSGTAGDIGIGDGMGDNPFHLPGVHAGAAHEHQQPDPLTLAAARESGYANHFRALHANRPWRPAIAGAQGARLHPRPLIHGVQSAVVVGPGGSTHPNGSDELYGNARGDVRVRFHWQHAAGADGAMSRWVRVAQRQAGAGMGWQWLPRIGQEVLVTFTDGDPDQPIVIGGLYNGRGEAGEPPSPGANASSQASDTTAFGAALDAAGSAQGNHVASGTGGHAPAWHGASAGSDGHRNAAALWGFKSKEFGGSGFSQLVFDDSDQQLRVQLHASPFHSQLNLGHIVHQQDNYRGSFRGEGFELRTDAYAALRGGQGVLLTTYLGPAGDSLAAGDATGAVALLRQYDQLMKTLDDMAQAHHAVRLAAAAGSHAAGASLVDPERAPATALLNTLDVTVADASLGDARADAQARHVGAADNKVPHSADPVVAVAARGGLVAVSGQHQHWVAGETVSFASGGDMNVVPAEALRLHAGQAIGILAATANADHDDTGLALIAGSDALSLHAQHDALGLRARDTVQLTGVEGPVDVGAAGKIRIATQGGASITIEGGNITFACPGTITYHAAQRSLTGPTSLAREMNAFPDAANFDEDLVLLWPFDEKPVVNQRFEITRGDGTVIRGVTDANGSTGLQKGVFSEQIKLRLLPDDA